MFKKDINETVQNAIKRLFISDKNCFVQAGTERRDEIIYAN